MEVADPELTTDRPVLRKAANVQHEQFAIGSGGELTVCHLPESQGRRNRDRTFQKEIRVDRLDSGRQRLTCSPVQAAEAIRRDAEHTFEGAGEVEGIVKTSHLSHLLHERIRFFQEISCPAHLEMEQVLIRALMVVTSEETAEVGPADVTLGRDLL